MGALSHFPNGIAISHNASTEFESVIYFKRESA
jgi:hypothetical protein